MSTVCGNGKAPRLQKVQNPTGAACAAAPRSLKNPRARWVTQGRQRPLPSNPRSKLSFLTGNSSRRSAFSAAWLQTCRREVRGSPARIHAEGDARPRSARHCNSSWCAPLGVCSSRLRAGSESSSRLPRRTGWQHAWAAPPRAMLAGPQARSLRRVSAPPAAPSVRKRPTLRRSRAACCNKQVRRRLKGPSASNARVAVERSDFALARPL